MRTHSALALIFFVFVAFLGCQKSDDTPEDSAAMKPANNMKKMEWIVGTWQRETARGAMFENWKVVNDSVWEGMAYRVAGSDTIVLEKLSLVMRGDDIFYVPVVPHNPGPVYFRLIEQSDNDVKFINPEHDFPQTIIYRKISDDSIHAKIQGINEEEETTVDFYFKRTGK